MTRKQSAVFIVIGLIVLLSLCCLPNMNKYLNPSTVTTWMIIFPLVFSVSLTMAARFFEKFSKNKKTTLLKFKNFLTKISVILLNVSLLGLYFSGFMLVFNYFRHSSFF